MLTALYVIGCAFVDVQATSVELEQLDSTDSPDSLESAAAKDRLEDPDHRVCIWSGCS